MEKSLAVIGGVVGAVVSFLVDGLGLAVTVLIALMAIDYLTGIFAAIVNRELNSRIGFNGLIRKMYYLLLIGAIYLIALVIPALEHAGAGAAIAFCVLELVSITENGTKMNIYVPDFIKNILAIVKEKTGEGGNKGSDLK